MERAARTIGPAPTAPRPIHRPPSCGDLARYAGVHIYSDSEDVLYADAPFAALHTVRAGQKCVHLPRPADAWEVYSGRRVARDAALFDDRMEAEATHVVYYGDPRPP